MNFRMASRAVDQAHLSRELCVTAQAGMPMKPALASICLSPQLSPRCPRRSRSRPQPWSATLPNLPERGQGREGRPGESRGRAQRPADLLPVEPFQSQAMPDSGPWSSVPSGAHSSPHQATNHQPGHWVVWAHVVTFRC